MPATDSIADPKGFTQRVSFAPGRELFRQGDAPRDAYIVERGRIEISFEMDRERIVIGYREPGELVGEMALIDDHPRSATATAMEPTVCVVVSSRLLAQHIGRSTPLVQHMLRAFAKNLRNAIDRQIETKSRLRSNAT